MFDHRYKKQVIWFLLLLLVLIGLIGIDAWIMPQKTRVEELYGYREITIRSNHEGARFYTVQGTSFSLGEAFIWEPEVTISSSYLFGTITEVKSRKKDYTPYLISGFHGINAVLCSILTFSTIISLFFLWKNETLTQNQYWNIILFQGLMLFLICAMWFHYSFM
ncbi:hypothetical protein ACKUSY_04935 [Myroides odoratus]